MRGSAVNNGRSSVFILEGSFDDGNGVTTTPTTLLKTEGARFGSEGRPYGYYEKTYRIGGFDVAYRAPAEGPDKMRIDDFEAYAHRLSGILFAQLYSK